MILQKISINFLIIFVLIFFFLSCTGGKREEKFVVNKKKISSKKEHKRKKIGIPAPKKRQKFNNIIYWRGSPDGKKVALTFDDGPHPVWTQKVLDILKEHKIKATFFLIGSNVEKYPWVVKRIAEEGHIIGNHTYTHKVVGSYSPTQAKREIEKTQMCIKNITGKKTYLLRPPYGSYQQGFYQVAKDYNYKIILWSVTVADWKKNLSSNEIAYRVITSTKPGAIILLHDGGGRREATVKALPRIIKALKKEGYKFVTVEEMLKR